MVKMLASGEKNCTFPFRYDDVLYYACTNLTASDDTGPWHFCATETDLDFNALKLGECHMDIVDSDSGAPRQKHPCPSQRE